ncbi:MAG: transcriptional repressor LexA [Opitutales bacterium]
MKDLTLRQQEILGFLQVHQTKQGYWPSIREIQEHFQFKSTNAVMGHLRALERKGYISRIPGQARTFRITYQHDDTRPDDALNVVDMDIPMLGQIAAGYPDGVEPTGEIGRLQLDEDTARITRSRRSFALKVRGESMIDAGIFDGDIVIIEPRLPNNGDVVAALIDGETTLKRFVQEGRKPPYLKAENPHYPQLHPVAELVIQGVAKAVVRSL